MGIWVWTRWSGMRIPADVRHLLFSKTPRPVRKACPASYVMGTAGSFLEVTVSGRGEGGGVEFHSAHPSNVEFRNDRKCTPTPAIKVHGTDRKEFTKAFLSLQGLSLLLQTTFMTLVQSWLRYRVRCVIVDAMFSETLTHGRCRSEATSVELDEVVIEHPVNTIYSGQILNKFKEVSLQLSLQFQLQ